MYEEMPKYRHEYYIGLTLNTTVGKMFSPSLLHSAVDFYKRNSVQPHDNCQQETKPTTPVHNNHQVQYPKQREHWSYCLYMRKSSEDIQQRHYRPLQ